MTSVITFAEPTMISEAAELVSSKLKRKGWTQGELRRQMIARGDRVPTGIICRWLSGKGEPSISRMVLIDSILGGVPPKLWAAPAKGKAA